MIYHYWLQHLPHDPNKEGAYEEARKQFDSEMAVQQWGAPLNARRAQAKPRVTEDGLTVPDWFADDETESQRMLAAMGME